MNWTLLARRLAQLGRSLNLPVGQFAAGRPSAHADLQLDSAGYLPARPGSALPAHTLALRSFERDPAAARPANRPGAFVRVLQS